MRVADFSETLVLSKLHII